MDEEVACMHGTTAEEEDIWEVDQGLIQMNVDAIGERRYLNESRTRERPGTVRNSQMNGKEEARIAEGDGDGENGLDLGKGAQVYSHHLHSDRLHLPSLPLQTNSQPKIPSPAQPPASKPRFP